MLQQPDRYGTHSLFELVAEHAAIEPTVQGITEQTLFGDILPLAV